jgi:hypothetical protein
MRIPPVLKQPTLWLVLGPLLALAAVVGVTQLGSGSPAEERAERTATTTSSSTTTSTTAPGDAATAPPSAPAPGSESAAAEVLGIQEDDGFSSGESLAGVGFDDGATTEVLGESFVSLDLTAPPPDPTTPATTTPPTTVPTTTVPSTSAPSTTAPSTTASTTTVVPAIQAQSRTVEVALVCSLDPGGTGGEPLAVPSTVTVGISTLTGVPSGGGLPVLVGLLRPTNLVGEALRGELAQIVRISAPGTGAAPQQLQATNPLPIAAGAVVPIPDGGDDFLAGTFGVTAAPGSPITVVLDSITLRRTLPGGATSEQSCVPAAGQPAVLASLAVASADVTTTTIALPDPVVPESPFTALLPISAVVVGGAALALLARRRRRSATAIAGGGASS